MAKQILVVDDDPVLRLLLTEYLSLFGHSVESSDCGTRCLEKIRAAPTLPDLLVLDLMMPDMTGFDVLKALRGDERTSALPVILLSANGNTESMAREYGVDANRYIDKPFEIKTILTAIQGLENEGAFQK